jgi:succinate dehydrogenase / fumarate reductase cytochrome b subunit
MSWLTAFLNSSIGQKVVVALTGLFLCTFLVVHMIGNLQLIWGTADKFNLYTYTMTHNKVIKLLSYVTYASILLHAFMAIWVNRRNAGARPVGYAERGRNSSWSSRNMVFLGVVVFVYIIVHLYNFWYVMKFGEIGTVVLEGKHVKDLYPVVINAFQVPWLVALYVIGMLALAYHLIHGVQSGFQTVGVNHPKYTPFIKNLGLWVFGILIPLGFAAIPVAVYFLKDPIPVP